MSFSISPCSCAADLLSLADQQQILIAPSHKVIGEPCKKDLERFSELLALVQTKRGIMRILGLIAELLGHCTPLISEGSRGVDG